MKMRNTILDDFGGFKLDTSKIDLLLVDGGNVILRYYGDLPDTLWGSSIATIRFNMKSWWNLRVVLTVGYSNGDRERFLLDTTKEEIKAILDRLFPDGGTSVDCMSAA